MKPNSKPTGISTPTYNSILKDISLIYENAQTEGDGNWNKTNLFAHWKIGERIIEVEQGKQERAAYGDMVWFDTHARKLLLTNRALNDEY